MFSSKVRMVLQSMKMTILLWLIWVIIAYIYIIACTTILVGLKDQCLIKRVGIWDHWTHHLENLSLIAEICIWIFFERIQLLVVHIPEISCLVQSLSSFNWQIAAVLVFCCSVLSCCFGSPSKSDRWYFVYKKISLPIINQQKQQTLWFKEYSVAIYYTFNPTSKIGYTSNAISLKTKQCSIYCARFLEQ